MSKYEPVKFNSGDIVYVLGRLPAVFICYNSFGAKKVVYLRNAGHHDKTGEKRIAGTTYLVTQITKSAQKPKYEATEAEKAKAQQILAGFTNFF